MGTGAGRGSRCGRRVTLAAFVVLSSVLLSACGSEKFANDPRPASPIEVAAKIDANRVAVSPNSFGAGLVTFTVANFSKSPVHFELSGPRDATTDEIKPGEPGFLEIQLPEGDYSASAGSGADAEPASFTVGPNRPSSRNKLLLP